MVLSNCLVILPYPYDTDTVRRATPSKTGLPESRLVFRLKRVWSGYSINKLPLNWGFFWDTLDILFKSKFRSLISEFLTPLCYVWAALGYYKNI